MIRESWAVETRCVECGKDDYLTGFLCSGCRQELGYEQEDE